MTSNASENHGVTGFEPNKIYMLGEKGCGLKPRGPLQNYQELKVSCQQNQILFEDPLFSPGNIPLGQGLARVMDRVVWQRPKDMVRNPEFSVDGLSRFDVKQGSLGDCWFLAALANITQTPKLMEFVAPTDQDFHQNYAGIFHFRFWQYGRWIDVVVDDRLPTVDGKLVFLRSEQENEFWPGLLEKAYAKLYGSYQNLDSGLTSEALADLTGGLSVMYNIPHPQLFDILNTSFDKLSFMGCAILSNEMEGRLENGLVSRHAYSITKVVTIHLQDEFARLLRIRNPWGEHEWRGPWSDKHRNWNKVPKKTRTALLKKENDGEFWMEYADFVDQYSFVEICYPTPNAYEIAEKNLKNWNCQMFDGSWVANVTAGGSPEQKTFSKNPQYIIKIEGNEPSKRYSMIVALMQKNRRIQKQQNIPIGFYVYKVAGNELGSVSSGIESIGSFEESHDSDTDKKVNCAPFRRSSRKKRTAVSEPLSFGSEPALNYADSKKEKAPGLLSSVRRSFKRQKSSGSSSIKNKRKIHLRNAAEMASSVGGTRIHQTFFEANAPMERRDFECLKQVTLDVSLYPGTYCVVPCTESPNLNGEFLLRVYSQVDYKMADNDDEIGYTPELKKLKALSHSIKMDDSLSQHFITLAGEDGEIDWKELKEVLDLTTNHGKTQTFSKDICRSLIAMVDTDASGKLNYEEFKQLWWMVTNWKGAFNKYDVDKSETINGFELREALNSAGYTLNNRLLNFLMLRYGNGEGELELDDFLLCSMKIKSIIDAFEAKEKDGSQRALVSLEEWLESSIYC